MYVSDLYFFYDEKKRIQEAYEKGRMDAIDMFLGKVLTEIDAKSIYENHNLNVRVKPLQDAIRSIALDVKERF